MLNSMSCVLSLVAQPLGTLTIDVQFGQFIMVAPARPAFNISADRRTITYQSLDNTDEALYNSLQFQYERNAFLDAIQTRLNAIAAESERTLFLQI